MNIPQHEVGMLFANQPSQPNAMLSSLPSIVLAACDSFFLCKIFRSIDEQNDSASNVFQPNDLQSRRNRRKISRKPRLRILRRHRCLRIINRCYRLVHHSCSRQRDHIRSRVPRRTKTLTGLSQYVIDGQYPKRRWIIVGTNGDAAAEFAAMCGELGDLELDDEAGDALVWDIALGEEADGACAEEAVAGAHDVVAKVVECLVVYRCVW